MPFLNTLNPEFKKLSQILIESLNTFNTIYEINLSLKTGVVMSSVNDYSNPNHVLLGGFCIERLSQEIEQKEEVGVSVLQYKFSKSKVDEEQRWTLVNRICTLVDYLTSVYNENLTEKFQKIKDCALDILANQNILENFLKQFNDGHLCKKRGFLLKYSATKIGMKYMFVHIPKSCFAKGSEKSIHLAINVVNGELLAFSKRKFYEIPLNQNYLKNELSLYQRCKDITQFVKVYAITNEVIPNTPVNSMFLNLSFMKLYQNGDADFFRNKNEPVPEHLQLSWSLSAAKGIQALHEHLFTHNDIKTINFLIDEDGNLRLCDFGFVKDGLKNTEKGVLRGTASTIAPEKLIDAFDINNFDDASKAEIYSLGACFYSFLFGKEVPWQNDPDDITIIENLFGKTQADFNLLFPEPQNKNSYAYICWKMLQRNPKDRPTIDEVVNQLQSLKIHENLANADSLLEIIENTL